MLGFKFPENFNSPYTSVSITEFWRKWHITLGTFMRDYLYKPLGGNRNGTTSTYRNLFIVFLLSGLWHGASWNFVLWGAFHGFFLVVERLSGLSKSTRYGLLRVPITFLIVILGWVVFRIEDTGHAMAYYKTLFQFDGIMPIYLFRKKLVVTLIVAALFSFITLTPIGKRWADHFYREHFKGRSVHLYGVIALIIFIWSTGSLATGAFNPFIYFRF
jgi:alginate O-acetyltransferase complex protein AlgI